MDETQVHEYAERHANAVVAGDLRTAGGDLLPEAQGQAPGVMKALPDPVTSAEITKITAEDGGAYLAYITYQGGSKETIVLSRWTEQEGRPMIAELTLA